MAKSALENLKIRIYECSGWHVTWGRTVPPYVLYGSVQLMG